MESIEGTAGAQSEPVERFAQLWGEGDSETESAPMTAVAERSSPVVIRAERV